MRVLGVPHVVVFGGRTRCTTCRISIDRNQAALPPPTDMEGSSIEVFWCWRTGTASLSALTMW